MRRYAEEKEFVARRAQNFRRTMRRWGEQSERWAAALPDGKFRKQLRCGGCRRSRCRLCHSDKFPKRTPTRQEEQHRADTGE